jgi:carbamoyltransferase
MYIIGINEGINSSVVVANDKNIIFALQEERVLREKNYMGFPHRALDFAVDYLNIKKGDISLICLSNLCSPTVSKESFLASYDNSQDTMLHNIKNGEYTRIIKRISKVLPKNIKTFIKSKIPILDPEKIMVENLAKHGLDKIPIERRHHHFNHAASVYFGLRKVPDDKYLVMTLDGGGDGDCSHIYIGQNGKLNLIASTPLGHSVGNIYSRITYYMGMTPHEHEYKVMGLAAYAKDIYSKRITDKFYSYLDLDKDNPLIFKSKIPELTFSIQKRFEEDFRRVRFDVLAGGLQKYTEELILKWIKNAISATGIKKVLVSGGVFMNIKVNSLIAQLDELEYFDVFPSCGDETLPFGAIYAHMDEASNGKLGSDPKLKNMYLGPTSDYDFNQAIIAYNEKIDVRKMDDPEKETAELLASGKIVARCSGKMEFGARSLGNRSILADPGEYSVIPEINKMIKQRDFWMPFAPAVLREKVNEYMEVYKTLPQDTISPYMMITFKSNDKRKEFVAGTHAYDETTRAQIVIKDMNKEFYRLIEEFSKLKNKSIILNTSFNLHGYPIVMGTKDAIDVLLNSSLEYLVVNEYMITKKIAS